MWHERSKDVGILEEFEDFKRTTLVEEKVQARGHLAADSSCIGP